MVRVGVPAFLICAFVHFCAPVSAFAGDVAGGDSADSSSGYSEAYTNQEIERGAFIQAHQQIYGNINRPGDYTEYLEGLAARCPAIRAAGKKGLIVTFRNNQTHQQFNETIICNQDGSKHKVYSADELVRRLVPASGNPLCPMPGMGNETIAALSKHVTAASQDQYERATCGRKNPDNGPDGAPTCAAAIGESFKNDWHNLTGTGDQNKQGCIGSLFHIFWSNIVSSGKVIVDAGKWVGKEAVAAGQWTADHVSAAWNSLMGEDNKSSDNVLTASSQSDKTVAALKKGDDKGIMDSFEEFTKKIYAGIGHVITDELGCREWSGKPFESECIAPLTRQCMGCGEALNIGCSVIGFLGSEFVMNMATGFALGASTSALKALAKTPAIARQLMKITEAAEIIKSTTAMRKIASVGGQASRLGTLMLDTPLAAPLSTILRKADGVSLLESLTAKIPWQETMSKYFSTSHRLGEAWADSGLAWVTGAKVETRAIQVAKELDGIDKAYDKLAKTLAYNKVAIGMNDGKAVVGAVDEFMATAEKSFQKMGYTVDRTDPLKLRVISPDGAEFTYDPQIYRHLTEIKQGAVTPDEIAKTLKQTDNIFAIGHGTDLMGLPPELSAGVIYRRQSEIGPGVFRAQFAEHELGRSDEANKYNATYGINPDSKYVPISVETY